MDSHAQYSISLLLRENESSPDSTLVIAAPGNGVFLLKSGRELLSLEQKEVLLPVQFPDFFIAEDATFTSAGLYVKNGNGIYYCNGQPILTMLFDTDNFRILPTADDNLFVFSHGLEQKALYTFNCQNKDVTLIAQFPNDVVYAYGTRDEAFVVAGNCIYLLSEHKVLKLLDYFEPIITAAQTESGLFFGTENNVMLLIDKDIIGLVEEFGCKQLLSSDGRLFIYKKDGSLLCYPVSVAE